MKKFLLFFALMLFFTVNSYSQASFNTGAIGVDINEYGKIELTNSAGIYQLWRTSILVGTSSTAVFDYQNDAEQLEPTILVSNPMMSDFEIYGAYDNSYSGDPPDVIVKLNAYGWTNGGYIIVKFEIENTAMMPINALAGLDIIPFIDEEDGFDSVSFNSTDEVIRIHRGNQTNIGMKLLSSPLKSLFSFEYYEDYYVDSDYWTWMNHGSVQPLYASNSVNGSVSITSQDAVTVAPGESFEVFYAMSLGANEQAMLSNIAAAEQRYEAWFAAVNDMKPLMNEFSLGQNYPNPVNSSTTITYQLPDDGFVSLKVYDATGNEVASLVNSEQTPGSYTIEYNAENLAGGMYFYTLRFNDQLKSNKLFVIR